jgi:acetylornithine deacetylase/succinyl-diaminopimelate desuccinylase-like protein
MPNVTGSVENLRANATELSDRFQRLGAAMEVIELENAGPVVVGKLTTARPTATLGVYVHYDGQPVDPDQWTTPPFSATLSTDSWHENGQPIGYPSAGDPIDPEWRIYARGASDDKTPFAAIQAAIEALESADLKPTVDLVFLFEGEEESGSPNLARYLEMLAPKLMTDAWLLCDGPVHQTRRPQIAFGVRGYSGFEVTFYGPERELHSGHYGNWVPNPVFELVSFLAACKDDQGMVTIDRFYDDTRPISEADRQAIDELPPIEAVLSEQLGFAGSEVTEGSYAERLMLPSFNIRGFKAADVGASARNVIPSEATASVDIRLAAGDDPDRMLDRVEARLESEGYLVLDREPTPRERREHRQLAKMTRAPGYPAVRTPMDSPLASTLMNAARVAARGEVIALPTFGGSIPLHHFEEILGSPVAIVPIANHDNNQHAADENVRVGNIWYGVDLWATLLTTDFASLRAG